MDIRVRNLSDDTHRRLKAYCAIDGISLEAQVALLITNYVYERTAREAKVADIRREEHERINP
jgi:plasmid stability protein